MRTLIWIVLYVYMPRQNVYVMSFFYKYLIPSSHFTFTVRRSGFAKLLNIDIQTA